MPPECTAPGRQDRFNPHPANRPGDACPQIGNSSKDGGFNPHPANRPGDAIQRHLRSFPIAVSIRTRLTGRVMRGLRQELVFDGNVSIRTRLTGRVMHLALCMPFPSSLFQSAPG